MAERVLMELEGLACGYRGRPVLAGIDLAVRRGELLCLLGPNGVGKTTLFKTVLCLLPPLAGRVRLNGEDVAGWPAARLARTIGYVPQAHTPPFPFRVLDVVAMGRAAHLGPFAAPSRADMALARAALETLSIPHLADRPYTEVSGGERQLVLVARALTQQPEMLVLDEPTASLDFGNQIAVLDHVRDLARDSGMAVVLTTHDPNHALRYADRVAAIERTGTVVAGAPEAVVTEGYLLRTYGVPTQMVRAGGGLVCAPVARTARDRGSRCA